VFAVGERPIDPVIVHRRACLAQRLPFANDE
jgi:hypothetical protein